MSLPSWLTASRWGSALLSACALVQGALVTAHIAEPSWVPVLVALLIGHGATMAVRSPAPKPASATPAPPPRAPAPSAGVTAGAGGGGS